MVEGISATKFTHFTVNLYHYFLFHICTEKISLHLSWLQREGNRGLSSVLSKVLKASV